MSDGGQMWTPSTANTFLVGETNTRTYFAGPIDDDGEVRRDTAEVIVVCRVDGRWNRGASDRLFLLVRLDNAREIARAWADAADSGEAEARRRGGRGDG